MNDPVDPIPYQEQESLKVSPIFSVRNDSLTRHALSTALGHRYRDR